MISESEIPENPDDVNAIIAIGDNQIRQDFAKDALDSFCSLVSPNAVFQNLLKYLLAHLSTQSYSQC